MTAVWYWDASALVSVLFEDEHSRLALRHLRTGARHIVSSLAWAETQAVIARAGRSGLGKESHAARLDLEGGPWQHLAAAPATEIMPELARRWALRGADLWHLAFAVTLRAELPELAMLTFDERLREAAAGEGLHSNA